MHECPQRDCQKSIPDSWIACFDHWYGLPKEVRENVEAAASKVPFAYREAVREAIDMMNRVPDEPRVLWEECGMRCARYGTESDGFIQFESGLYNRTTNVTDWQEVTAVQIVPLLRILGEHFEKACRIADRTREEDYAIR